MNRPKLHQSWFDYAHDLEKYCDQIEKDRSKWYRRYTNLKFQMDTLKEISLKLRGIFDKKLWGGEARKILDEFDKQIKL